MGESKHTPGPWEWQVHDHSCASLGVGDSPGYGDPLVMSVSPCRACAERANGEWEWGRCTTPSEADARLIAAAPDLLAFAKRVMADHRAKLPSEARDLYGGGCGCPQCEQAAAAIQKAEGK